MPRKHLEDRAKWQDISAARGKAPEETLRSIMSIYLARCADGDMEYVHKPRDLCGIYGTLKSKNGVRQHGIKPDGMIVNRANGRRVFVEMKRQRAKGNAHERACKYMMPGIVASMREHSGHAEPIIPMWWIFTGGIAENPKYRQEIGHWFKGMETQPLFWPDWSDAKTLIAHFEEYIKGMLL